MNTPYVSIIFANRNDGYGGDQAERFHYFIEYYAAYVQRYPDLFEFIICDWNPPAEKPSLIASYPWSRLGRVKSIVVSKEIHQHYAKDCKRPILEYIARNVCIRHSTAPWTLIINQDIYLSLEIIKYIAERKLDERFFYRADRVDFDFEKFKAHHPKAPEEFVNVAKSCMTKRHLRPLPNMTSEDMSPSVNNAEFLTKCSKIQEKEMLNAQEQIAYGVGYQQFMETIKPPSLVKKIFSLKKREYLWIDFCLHFGLHTNASGDFILASKQAFEKIHGFPETIEFYMHSDSHNIVQLFASGYTQAVFLGAACVFHADHPRHDRVIDEKWQFSDHVNYFGKLCYEKKDFRFNSRRWGLINFQLPMQIL